MRKLFILAFISFVLLSQQSQATPASPAMLDGNGCHVCKKVCEKFGVSKNEYHCHIFSPEAFQTYKRSAGGTASNPETMFAENILMAMDYVSLKSDKSGIMIAPINKNMEGSYKVVSQSCGFGDQKVVISKGAPARFPKLFGSKFQSSTEGLLSITLNKAQYPAIATASSRFLVINESDDIVCAGQSVKTNLYLYCKSTLSAERRAGAAGLCRTSLEKE